MIIDFLSCLNTSKVLFIIFEGWNCWQHTERRKTDEKTLSATASTVAWKAKRKGQGNVSCLKYESVTCTLLENPVLTLLQWNPINTVTNKPCKFGRINGLGSNFVIVKIECSLNSRYITDNKPFLSRLVLLFQNKSLCKTLLMRMSLTWRKNELSADLITMVSHKDSFWHRRKAHLWNKRPEGRYSLKNWYFSQYVQY